MANWGVALWGTIGMVCVCCFRALDRVIFRRAPKHCGFTACVTRSTAAVQCEHNSCRLQATRARSGTLRPRFLRMAGRMPRSAPPQQRAAMEGALTLAIRAGLPPAAFLERLLAPSPGAPVLYEGFRSVVRTPADRPEPRRPADRQMGVPLRQGAAGSACQRSLWSLHARCALLHPGRGHAAARWRRRCTPGCCSMRARPARRCAPAWRRAARARAPPSACWAARWRPCCARAPPAAGLTSGQGMGSRALRAAERGQRVPVWLLRT